MKKLHLFGWVAAIVAVLIAATLILRNRGPQEVTSNNAPIVIQPVRPPAIATSSSSSNGETSAPIDAIDRIVDASTPLIIAGAKTPPPSSGMNPTKETSGTSAQREPDVRQKPDAKSENSAAIASSDADGKFPGPAEKPRPSPGARTASDAPRKETSGSTNASGTVGDSAATPHGGGALENALPLAPPPVELPPVTELPAVPIPTPGDSQTALPPPPLRTTETSKRHEQKGAALENEKALVAVQDSLTTSMLTRTAPPPALEKPPTIKEILDEAEPGVKHEGRYFVHRVQPYENLWVIVQRYLATKYREVGIQLPPDADERLLDGSSSPFGREVFLKEQKVYVYNVAQKFMGNDINFLKPYQDVVLLEDVLKDDLLLISRAAGQAVRH